MFRKSSSSLNQLSDHLFKTGRQSNELRKKCNLRVVLIWDAERTYYIIFLMLYLIKEYILFWLVIFITVTNLLFERVTLLNGLVAVCTANVLVKTENQVNKEDTEWR